MEAQKEILELTRELEHAGFLYYVKDAPEMTDYDYDRKLRRLEELEAQYPEFAQPNSPTRRVGGQALEQFVKVRHTVPLESLQDVFSFDELREFDERLRKDEPEAIVQCRAQDRRTFRGARVYRRRICPRRDTGRRAYR